jgi:hypothetical protein
MLIAFLAMGGAELFMAARSTLHPVHLHLLVVLPHA